MFGHMNCGDIPLHRPKKKGLIYDRYLQSIGSWPAWPLSQLGMANIYQTYNISAYQPPVMLGNKKPIETTPSYLVFTPDDNPPMKPLLA